MYRKHDDDLTPEEQARYKAAWEKTLSYQFEQLGEAFQELWEVVLETMVPVVEALDRAVARLQARWNARGKR